VTAPEIRLNPIQSLIEKRSDDDTPVGDGPILVIEDFRGSIDSVRRWDDFMLNVKDRGYRPHG